MFCFSYVKHNTDSDTITDTTDFGMFPKLKTIKDGDHPNRVQVFHTTSSLTKDFPSENAPCKVLGNKNACCR